jgi:hypothetical protein
VSGRAADAGHLRMSSSHPVKFTLSPQGSACAGIKPGTRTSRTRRFFALTHSMNMHGRAAAMVTPIGDKKTLLPAESAVSSSGCAGQGRVKRAARERTNGSTQGCRERSDAKVCASASVAEGPSATLFVDFLRCTKSDLGTIGDGAPPQDVWHRLWSLYTPRSPPTKFGVYVTVCNRRFPL